MLRGRMLLTPVALLVILGLLLMASCAPTAAPTPTAKPALATPKPAAPTPKPPAAVKTGGILKIANPGDPPGYDMHKETSDVVFHPFGPAYSGLLQYSWEKPAEIIPDLAEKWELSPDGLTYTFHLRKDVKWHDGKPFTSADVPLSIKRMQEKSPQRDFYFEPTVKSVDTPDANTAKINLNYASVSFPKFVAMAICPIMPKHVIEAKGDMKRDVVGTGAFKFKEYRPGAHIEFVKNPDYFIKGRPYLDGYRYHPVRDATTRLAAFRTKQVDILTPRAMTPAQLDQVQKEMPGAKAYQLLETGYWWNFYMPMDKAPWTDPRVRKAAYLTIDRQKAIKVVEEGKARLTSVLPPEVGGIPTEELLKMPSFRQPKDADIAEAKKLMAAAGFPDGFESRCLYRVGTAYETAALFVKDQLAQIGIRLTIYTMEDAAFYDTVYKRGYHSHVHRHPLVVADPDALLPQYYKTGAERNYANVSDKVLDELITEQSKIADPKKRLEVVRKIEDRLMELAAVANFGWGGYIGAHWDYVKGYAIPTNHYNDMKWIETWLDK